MADALSKHGWCCAIVSSETSYNFVEDLNRYERIDPKSFFQRQNPADLLIIDSYTLDYEYELHFRPLMKKIMVIDDVPNRHHDCDILLDQTYARCTTSYKNLVPIHCKLLIGEKYALLRKEFIKYRPKAYLRRKEFKEVKRVLVSMGGGDPDNHVLKILEILKRSTFSGEIELVLGFSEQNKFYIELYLETYPLHVNIHINPNMAKLIYESDYAIGAAGSSMWERCCLGLPTFMVVCSNDQSLIAVNLHDANAAINLGEIDSIDIKAAASKIESIMKDSLRMGTLNKNAFAICDGLGVDRVVKEILHTC